MEYKRLGKLPYIEKIRMLDTDNEERNRFLNRLSLEISVRKDEKRCL